MKVIRWSLLLGGIALWLLGGLFPRDFQLGVWLFAGTMVMFWIAMGFYGKHTVK